MPQLILGSTSPFRKTLLDKLGIPFTTDSPHTDESRQPGESPALLVRRLAEAKAREVATRHSEALIIGSDQVACVDGDILGKPGNRDNAIAQLVAAAGKTVTFHTGLCLYNTDAQRTQVDVEQFLVRFRKLDTDQIERYVDREQPFDCAGSFKSEGFGITLFSSLEGRDPNALIGLPLILLVEMLAREGIVLP
jgi:MAF protein